MVPKVHDVPSCLSACGHAGRWNRLLLANYSFHCILMPGFLIQRTTASDVMTKKKLHQQWLDNHQTQNCLWENVNDSFRKQMIYVFSHYLHDLDATVMFSIISRHITPVGECKLYPAYKKKYIKWLKVGLLAITRLTAANALWKFIALIQENKSVCHSVL